MTPLVDGSRRGRLVRPAGAGSACSARLRAQVKPGLGQRQITDVPAALDKAKRVVPENEVFSECVKFSLTSFEGLIAKHLNLPKTSKKGVSAESWVATNFESLTKREPTKTLVVV